MNSSSLHWIIRYSNDKRHWKRGGGRKSPKWLIENPNVLTKDVHLHSLSNFRLYAIIGIRNPVSIKCTTTSAMWDDKF